jgi:hypothetical protein
MKNYVILCYLTEFVLEWEVFQKNLYRKSKHVCYVQKIFYRKSYRLYDNVKKYGRTGQTAEDNIIKVTQKR